MVKRKRLIILFYLYTASAQASAWLVPEGAWHIYYQNESYFESAEAKNIRLYSLAKLQKLENEIIKFKVKQNSIVNNPHLTEQAKYNRSYVLNQQHAAQLKSYNNLLYSYLPKNLKSYLIEYGFKDYATMAVKISNNTMVNIRGNELFQQAIEVAPRFKIMQNNQHMLSLQPKISYVNHDFYKHNTIATECRILYGKNRLLRNKKLRRFKIIHFTNMEFAMKTSDYKSTYYITSELTEGLKFKNNWQILWQNFLNKNNGRSNMYKQTLREQLAIAKTINSFVKNEDNNLAPNKEEVTIQLGYFIDYSLKNKRKFAEGIVFSLWLKI